MTPEELAAAVLAAVRAAVDAGDLAVSVPDSAVVERPKSREHGDYATNVALQLAKPAGRPPREVAALSPPGCAEHPGIATVEVAGPGFLNITLARTRWPAWSAPCSRPAPAYGRGEVDAGRQPSTWSSSRPTRPARCTSAHARWAAVGDALARLLTASGAEVTREYYFNDAGAQIDRFAALAGARPRPGSRPRRTATAGDYIGEIAAAVIAADTRTCSTLPTTKRRRSSGPRASS